MALQEEFDRSEEARKLMEQAKEKEHAVKSAFDALVTSYNKFFKIADDLLVSIEKERVQRREMLEKFMAQTKKIKEQDSELDNLEKQVLLLLIKKLRGR